MFDLHDEFQIEFFDDPNDPTYIDYFRKHQFKYESQRLIFRYLIDQYNYVYQCLFKRGYGKLNLREYELLNVIYGKICQFERETKVKYRNNCS